MDVFFHRYNERKVLLSFNGYIFKLQLFIQNNL